MRVIHQPPPPTFVINEYLPGRQIAASPPLKEHEVSIWYRNLACPPLELDRLLSLLSTDELERAQRFRFDSNRNEFIVARGTLRLLLGTYLAIAPAELRFTYSQYGRPSLVQHIGSLGLEFNLSHSSGVVLLAFARGRRIGVDVEKVRRDFATNEIAERFFSTAERAALRELPHEHRHEAFFRCWTRKEAFIKALGEGLSRPLDQFDVSLAPGKPAALLATRPDAEEVSRWLLWNVPVPGDYAAALAAESKDSSA